MGQRYGKTQKQENIMTVYVVTPVTILEEDLQNGELIETLAILNINEGEWTIVEDD